MKGLIKEPLVHFLLAGAALFAAYAWLDRGAAEREGGPRIVRITAAEVEWLKTTWARQWQRDPTGEELRGLVTDYLKEELLAREARDMGLDEDDTVVRRRLAQKMSFLVEDTARLAEPAEDDLRRFYEENPERFRTEARASFTHVYFDPRRRQDAAADAEAALAALASGRADPAQTGDRLLVEAEFHDADEPTVAGALGPEFARAVLALPAGAWHGPIASAYGLHLVRVSESRPAEKRPFAEARQQVLDSWRQQRQREDYERYLAGLLEKYDVVMDESVKPLIGSLDGSLPVPTPAPGERSLP